MLLLTPEAVYDTLLVVDQMADRQHMITETELTFFCYLACLLSVYDARPVGDWGYTFVSTPSISPFSVAIDSAVTALSKSGRLSSRSGEMSTTSLAQRDMTALSQQAYFRGRSRYLIAACNSTLVVPLPALGFVLSSEPNLRNALALSATRELLTDEFGPQALHRHFAKLSKELPDSKDMFMAAVAWIDILAREGAELSSDDAVGLTVSPTGK